MNLYFAALVVGLFDDTQAALPAGLGLLLQELYLETKLEEFAKPVNAYGYLCDVEEIPTQIGSTLTKTRPGLKGPIQIATTGAQAADDGTLENGITPSDPSFEQYTLAPQTYEDGVNLDLIGTQYAIVDRFKHYVRTNVVQAYQSRDILARDTMIQGYFTGNTPAIGAGSAALSLTVTATALVSDIRGLRDIVANGVLQAVNNAAGLKLACTVFPGGVVTGAYNVLIVGAASDALNVSSTNFVGSGTATGGATATNTRGNGISGTLTMLSAPAGVGAYGVLGLAGTGKTIAINDVIIANDAPKQFLAGSALVNWSGLTAANLLTQSQILDGKSWLEDQGMEPMDDGTFLCILSSRSLRGLYGDADFKQAFQGLGQSPFFATGRIDAYLGVTFLVNTNAPKIPIAAGGGFVHLPMLVGKGALIDGYFAGMKNWAASQYNDAYVALQDGIAQVITPPVDRLRRKLKMSWITIRDMTAPTDVTVNSNVILTSGGGRRKRSVILAHGASV